MPLVLIEGQFRILTAAPDGDSIRFYPTARMPGVGLAETSGPIIPGVRNCVSTASTLWRRITSLNARIYHSISRLDWAERQCPKCCAF
jgi:hypothetical protein